ALVMGGGMFAVGGAALLEWRQALIAGSIAAVGLAGLLWMRRGRTSPAAAAEGTGIPDSAAEDAGARRDESHGEDGR
ncbi:MAG: hypothetical protein ABEJ00_03280, partial [Gemmatimonadota bacterium]